MDLTRSSLLEGTSRLSCLVKAVERVEKRNKAEIFEIFNKDSEFRHLERTMSINAFLKVGKFANLCDRLWERQGNASSLSAKKAFGRWWVRTNYDFGRECIDRILASCRKTPRNVGMMFKIIVRKQMTLKKKKFLQFVSFLVERLNHSRDKILHNNKNFFFFSVCLIASKKKNEELSRIHNSFVHLLNFKLGQNAGAMMESVLKHSPKALLLNSLAKAAGKKAFDSLQSLRVFTKKTNFIACFKFVDLIQSKILNNFRQVIDNSQSVRQRFLELTISKINATLRRFLRQLANRSMMLRNKAHGLERFSELIERSCENAKIREAWGKIHHVFTTQKNLKKLESKIPVLEKLTECGLKSGALAGLRDFASKIQQNQKLALVKKLVGKQHFRLKNSFARLAAHNLNFKEGVRLIFKKLKKIDEFKLSMAYEKLVLNRLTAELSQRNSKGKAALMSLAEKLFFVAKIKKMRTLELLQRFNRRQKRGHLTICNFIAGKAHALAKAALQRLGRNTSAKFKSESQFRHLMRRQLNRKYKEALAFGFSKLMTWRLLEHKLDMLADTLKMSQKRSGQRSVSEVFQRLKQAQLAGRFEELRAEKQQQLLRHCANRTLHGLRAKQVEALQKLRRHNAKARRLSLSLLARLAKSGHIQLEYYFKKLQKNKDMYLYSTDQEKRKIKNFRIANALFRLDQAPKKRFVEVLKANAELKNHNDFVLKRTFQKMYRRFLAVSFSRLVGCVRTGKMLEIDKILTQTRNDLTQIHKEVLPQFNKLLIKNVVVGQPMRHFLRDAKGVLAKMRELVKARKTEAAKAKKLSTLFDRKALTNTLKELRRNRSEVGSKNEKVNFSAYCLEVLFRNVRRKNKAAAVQAVKKETENKRKADRVVINFINKIKQYRQRVALHKLEQNAHHLVQEQAKTKQLVHQRNALEKLRDLERARRIQAYLSFISDFNSVKNSKNKLKNVLENTHKRFLKNSVGELKIYAQESKTEAVHAAQTQRKQKRDTSILVKKLKEKQREVLTQLRTLLRSQNNEFRFADFVRKFTESRVHKFLTPLKALSLFKSRQKQLKAKQRSAIAKMGGQVRQLLRNTLAKLRKGNRLVKNSARVLFVNAMKSHLLNLRTAFRKLSLLSTTRLAKKAQDMRRVVAGTDKLRGLVRGKIKDIFEKIARKKQGFDLKFAFRRLLGQSEKRLMKDALDHLRTMKSQAKRLDKLFQKLVSRNTQKTRLGLFSLKLYLKQMRAKAEDSQRRLAKFGQSVAKRWKADALRGLKAHKVDSAKRSTALSQLLKASSLKTISTLASLKEFQKMRSTHLRKSVQNLAAFCKKKSRSFAKDAFQLLRAQQSKRRFQKILETFHSLGVRAHSKKAAAFVRLRNPEFRKQQIERGLFSLSNTVTVAQFEFKNRALQKLKRLSPISQFKSFKTLMVLLTKVVQKSLLFGVLAIQAVAYNPKRHRVFRPEKLAAIRFIKNAINSRNSMDAHQLKYPALLKLRSVAKSFAPSPAQLLTLQRLEQALNPPRPEDFQEKSKKIAETKLENLEFKSKNNAIQIGNHLLLEKNKLLINENESLEKEAEKLQNEKQELSKAIKGLQKESDAYDREIQDLQKECEKLGFEREQLKNEQKLVEERLLAMDPNFDLNASKLRASILCGSMDNLQASQLLISKATRERKDLEDLVQKYQEETRALEDEMHKLEEEELEILAKVVSLRDEKVEMEKKMKEKDDQAAAVHAENERLKLETQNTLRLLEEARKVQANLLPAVSGAAIPQAEIAQRTKAFEAEKKKLVAEMGTHSQQAETLRSKIDQLNQLISQAVPANKTVEAHTQQLEAEVQALEAKKLSVAGSKNLLFEKLKGAKRELTNLIADKGYLQNQLRNHHENKAKYEKELADPNISPQQRKLMQDKVAQMVQNIKVIEDNIQLNEKNIEAETKQVQQMEADVQNYDNELAKLDSGIAARRSEIKEVSAANVSLVRLKQEEGEVAKAKDKCAAALAEAERSFAEFKKAAEGGVQADPENEKALARNRQQIARLESVIQNNKQLIDKNDAKSRNLESEQLALRGLIQEKEKACLDVDRQAGGIGQKKTAAQHRLEDLKMKLPNPLENVGDMKDFINMRESTILHRFGEKKDSHDASIDAELSPEAQVAKLYPPSEFVPNEYSQILKTDTGPSARRRLTSRLIEIRANLKEYGKDIEAKDENIKAIKQRLSGHQNILQNFNEILGQKVDQETELNTRINRNVSIIDENKRLFAQNAMKIKQNKEAIEKNYNEIKEINSEFRRFTTLAPPEQFLFDGKNKDMVSKKIQTTIKATAESRCQTDLDYGDIETLEKRAKQKHMVKIKESVAGTAPKISFGADAKSMRGEDGATQKSKDQVNFTQTQTYNNSFKIGRDLAVADNRLFDFTRGEPGQTVNQNGVEDPKRIADFGQKQTVEQATGADAKLDPKRQPEITDMSKLTFTNFPGELKKDKRDTIGFIKRNPPINPAILEEMDLIHANRMKVVGRVEPRKTQTLVDNPMLDYGSMSAPNENGDDMSFGNFDTERQSGGGQRTGGPRSKTIEVDQIYQFLMPKTGANLDTSLLSTQNQKFSLKFTDTSKTTNVKKLTKLLKMDAILRNKDSFQLALAFLDLLKAAHRKERQLQRRGFGVAKTSAFNNKKSRIQFQLKALKEQKAARNKTFGTLLGHVFDRRLATYFYNFCEGTRLLSSKKTLMTTFKKEYDIVNTTNLRRMSQIRKAKGTFDGILSRTIFRRLNQAFHQIFKFSQQRNQNFFKRFVPVIVRADENLKNLLMDVLQYWYNVRGESNWNQRIFRHFVFRASLTNQIAALRLKMFKKKPPKRLGAGREFAQRLAVVVSKQRQRLLAEGLEGIRSARPKKVKREASFNVLEASGECEGVLGPEDDSEREDLLKKYELIMSQQELTVINLNAKILNARLGEAIRRHLAFGLRRLIFAKTR